MSVLSLTIFDKNRLNSILTPFTVTAWPFVIIILTVNFLLLNFDFPPVTLRAQIFILLNIFLLWIIGYILSFFNLKYESNENRVIYSEVFKPFARFDIFILILSQIFVIIILYSSYQLIQQFGGWAFIADDRYEEMMSIGPVAHVVQLARVCFLLLLFVYKHSKHKALIILSLFSLFIAIASIQVKYHIIWLFIIGFLYINSDKKPSRQFRNVAILGLILVLLMNMFWIVLTLAWGTFDVENEIVWEFFLKQFLNYFVSAPICLDRWLDWSNIQPDWTILLVFQNMYYVIMGMPYRLNAVDYVNYGFLETVPGISSNVGTSYGVYYLIGGMPFTIFMTILISFFSYIVYFQSRRRRSPIILYFNLLMLTLGVLSFFVQYFTLFSLYELTAFFMIFIAILNIINMAQEKTKSV
jgi:oligosaccharide repeat unit polymerase